MTLIARSGTKYRDVDRRSPTENGSRALRGGCYRVLGTAFDAEDAGPGHNRPPARLISGLLDAAVQETVVHKCWSILSTRCGALLTVVARDYRSTTYAVKVDAAIWLRDMIIEIDCLLDPKASLGRISIYAILRPETPFASAAATS